MDPSVQPAGEGDGLSRVINRGVNLFVRHWVWFLNAALALYILAAFSAPLLMMAGLDGPARLLYLLFRATCHQLPQRSFFLDGPAAAYSFDTIAHVTGAQTPFDLFWHPVYDATLGLGYQVAFCQRDTAIYTAMLLTGVVYAVTGRRWKGLPWWGLVLLAVPIAADGLSQLPGWRESTPLLRVLTGALFGMGVVLFAFPMLNRGFSDLAPPATTEAGERP